MEDLFLDAGAVEGAVGEAVDGEDVGLGVFEPVAEAGEVIPGEEAFGGDGGEAEADGEGRVRGEDVAVAEFVAHGKDVAVEHGGGFLPGFGGVDVGAVGEVSVVEIHWGDG